MDQHEWNRPRPYPRNPPDSSTFARARSATERRALVLLVSWLPLQCSLPYSATSAFCSRREALRFLASLLALLTSPLAAVTADLPEKEQPPLKMRFADDPRLDQKVSVTAWAEPLEDLLARLSEQTGVSFNFLGRDVGDQRVNAVLKHQPLRRVQALLAELLDLSWLRERRAGVYRYVLFQDLHSRNAEAALRSRAREQFEQGIRRVIDSLNWSPEEVEQRLPEGSEWAMQLRQPGRRIAFSLLGKLSPACWQQFMQAGQLSIPFNQFSPDDQKLVLSYVEQRNDYRGKQDLEEGTPGRHHIGDVTQARQQGRVQGLRGRSSGAG